MKRRNPGPWRFYVRRYGLVHVIADANGEPMASSVPAGSGPLLAAGPELLAALQRVAELAPALAAKGRGGIVDHGSARRPSVVRR